MNILSGIFNIDTKSSSRIILTLFGIKIKFFRPGYKKQANEFINYDGDITQIPHATGSLRKVQLANLKMLAIFDKLCKENNIEYWLDYGNLLGAVRHKGFIPWDDDVDISLRHEDCNKLYNLYKTGIPGYPDLYLDYNNNGKNKCLLKLRHKKFGNLSTDIFIMDLYYKKTSPSEKEVLNDQIHKACNKPIYRLTQPLYLNKPQKILKRMAKTFEKEILKGNKPNPADKPSLIRYIEFPHVKNRITYDWETIYPLKEITYEGLKFPCPNKPEKVLEIIYGENYMKPQGDCYPRHANSTPDPETEKALDEFISDYKDKL